jgi:hypothetical protein
MPTFERLYSIEELVQLQRNALRYARSFSPRAEQLNAINIASRDVASQSFQK